MGKVKEQMICEDCGEEINNDPANPYVVAEELEHFIAKQDHWSEFYAPSIAYGMLLAVFKVVFHIAPNEKKAIKVILDALSEFTEEEADA